MMTIEDVRFKNNIPKALYLSYEAISDLHCKTFKAVFKNQIQHILNFFLFRVF